MPATPLTPNESARLQSLYALGILDTPRETSFDIISRLLSELLNVPMAAVSLVDANRQWFKSCVGLDVTETDRDSAFCSHAILSDLPLLVEDATQDPRFQDNRFVTGPPYIRFYAGVPLRLEDGFAVGTLCAISAEPKKLSEKELRVLTDLAILIQDQLSLKLAIRKQMDSQLKAIQAEKFASIGALAAGVAHEINTPMQFVVNNCDFIAKSSLALTTTLKSLLDMPVQPAADGSRLRDSEPVRKIREEFDLDFLLKEAPLAISQTKEGIERVTSLVTAMRDFSHSPQGGKRMEQINHSIQTTLILTRNSWKQIAEVSLDLDPHLPLVECNLGEINQVVLNLIVNAVDAVRERRALGWEGKGHIQIRTLQRDSMAVL